MKISVAMCTYNGERYVEEQVASIMSQSAQPHELCVFDDRSSDGTIALLEKLAGTAAFPIRISVNEQRLGSTKNFERAIGACTGDIIALCDQDDVWVPHKISVIADAFSNDPELGAFFSDSEVVDEQLRPLGYGMFDCCDVDADDFARFDRGEFAPHLIKASLVTGATLAFRGDLRKFILPIPPGTASMIHDGWIATMVSAVSKIDYTREKLVLYRQHSHQQIGAGLHSLNPESSLGSRLTRDRGQLAEHLASLLSLRGLIIANARDAVKSQFREAIDQRITHFDARAHLPSIRSRRVVPVLTELASGRYARFSNGTRSAIKDLLAS